MNSLATRPAVARFTLVAWTVFVWGSRVRNVIADDTNAGEKALSLVPACAFLAAAAWLAGSGWRQPAVVRAFAQLSTLWWALRSVLVLVRDHSVAFKVVHLVLAAVSITLAWWAARAAHAAHAQHASTP